MGQRVTVVVAALLGTTHRADVADVVIEQAFLSLRAFEQGAKRTVSSKS